jgi:membrane associated rhomboid family serine protease
MIPYRDNNPTQSWAFFTFLLILANIGVFILSYTGAGLVATNCYWGAVAADLTGTARVHAPSPLVCPPGHAPGIYTVFTHMFLHGGLLHLGGNMLYLWIFGNNIEDVLGHVNFLIFYVLCGLAALAVQVLAGPAATVPMVGASGAIAGILGAYMLLFPLARISVIVPIFIFLTTVEVPALFMLVLWFGMQVLNGMFESANGLQGGTAWYAHVGGFVAGVVLILLFPKKKRRKRR